MDMDDSIHNLLTNEADRWRAGLDPDPDLAGLLHGQPGRRRGLPAMLAASVAILAIAVGAIVVTARPTQHGAGALSHSATPASPLPVSSATTLADPVSCTKGQLHAPGVTARLATRAQLQAFNAVAAVDCVYARRRYPDGVWLVVNRQLTQGRVDPLVTALEKPDTTVAQGTACADYADIAPQLVLVDASGRFLRPRYPRDECDHIQAAAKTATARLHWRPVSTTKMSLDIPNDPVLRTCQRAWKNMIQFQAAQPPLSPGGTISATETATACIYRSDADPTGGAYASGARLDQQQTSQLAAALSGSGQTGTCAPQSRFAVIHFGDQLAYVELGGCWRILRPDGTLGHADSATVKRILKL